MLGKCDGGTPKDMKMIFVTREGYNLSGARVRCYNFARALRQYGIDTEVFSFADNLGARYGEKEFQMSLSEKIKYNIQAFKALLKKDKGSIFFMQRLNYHILAPFLISLIRKSKVIFDCDDWNIREDPVYYFGFYPSSKMEYLTRKIAKRSDICIAASRFLQEYLEKFNPRVYYMPTAVDTDSYKPRNNKSGISKIVFSWLGTAYHKEMGENIKFILECFSLLAVKFNNIFLEICGEGRYFDEARNTLDSLKYRERIKINGWIYPDNIPDYLSGIDIGLFPLIQDTKFNRAKSPTKLFEYMAMAKPTVSSAIGESMQIIRDGDNGFLAKTKKEFIEKMEGLIVDNDLCKKIGARARESAEKDYSLKVLGERLFEVLKTL